MDHHERDDLRRRRSRLSPAAQELLAELERSAEVFEPPSEGVRARIEALPTSERKYVVAVFGEMALNMAERQSENRQRAALAASSAEAIREAQERERAARRPVDPNMTLGDALEILGR